MPPFGLTRPVADRLYSKVIKPEFYGAVGDGTTDDTTAVQAALTAASAVNGTVSLSKMYRVAATGVTITGSIRVLGGGGFQDVFGGGAKTGLITTSTTAVGITIESNGVELRNFALVNDATGTITAGQGILLVPNNGNSPRRGDHNIIDTVHITGFYDSADIDCGSYWRVKNCFFYNATRHGLIIHNSQNVDGGDQFIEGNTFITTKSSNGAAIRWFSGGGAKIYGNKVNVGFQYGIQAAITSGKSTSVMVVNGNSFENTGTSSVYIDSSGGSYGRIVVTNNEMMATAASASSHGMVYITGSSNSANMHEVVVSGNTMAVPAAAGWAVQVGSCTNVHIGTNVIANGAAAGGVKIGSGAVQVRVDPQVVDTDGVLFLDTTYSGSNSNHGAVDYINHTYARAVPTTGKASASTLWKLGLKAGDSCIATVTLNGTVTGGGSYFTRKSFLLTRVAGAVTVVAAAGTDTTGGAEVANINLTVIEGGAATSDTYSYGVIGVQLGAGSAGTDVYGRASLRVEGGPSVVIRGAVSTIPTN
jgi:hypothetical protein